MTKQQNPSLVEPGRSRNLSNIKFLWCRESKMEDSTKPLVKVTLNLSLCMIKHHTIKAYGRAEA